MQWVTIKRRNGEEIPINPAMVCYVRGVGSVTTVALANGHEHRVAGITAAALAMAMEQAMDAEAGAKRHVPVIEEPPPPPPESGAPGGAPGAAEAPQAGEPNLGDEEAGREEGAAQRRQEAEPGDKPHAGAKK
jgi:hypothetical protein